MENYLNAISLFSGVSVIALIFLPESPKFLLSIGDKEGCIRVLQSIYARNFGASKNVL